MSTPDQLSLGVERARDELLRELDRPGKRAQLVGPTASGRTTLLDSLSKDATLRCITVDLRERDQPDAAIGAVYALAAALESERDRAAIFDEDWSDPGRGIEEAGRLLGEDVLVAVKLPTSWTLGGPRDGDEWSERSVARASSVREALAALKQRVLWVPGPGSAGHAALRSSAVVHMPPPRGAASILRQGYWRELQPHAERLHDRVDARAELHPVALRIGVGLLALGETIDDVAAAVGAAGPRNFGALVERLADHLGRKQHASLRVAVSRLLVARRPVARTDLPAITGAAESQLAFLSNVVGYGGETVRVHAVVRDNLIERLPLLDPAHELEAHRALAAHFARLDGAKAISETSSTSTDAWLEKVWSLAHTPEGPGDNQLACREQFWVRGRHLSRVRRDYAAAAEVYRACVARYPSDDYAWHYLGFNLDKAGAPLSEARTPLDKAVELAPENVWWNARRVTFLISRGLPGAADAAWGQALASIDPERDRIAHDPWLARHCHRWVADAWLEAGDAARAFSVLRSVPDAALRGEPGLALLRERVLDAVEADAIGESVYPSAFPVDRRWREPRFLPAALNGAPRKEWFPGRVVAAGREQVRVVYATRDERGDYTTLLAELPAATWSEWGLGAAESATGYVELGVYGEGEAERRLVVHAGAEVPPAAADEPILPLAHFDRWRSAS